MYPRRMYTHAFRDAAALRRRFRTNICMQEPVTDKAGKCAAMMTADQRMHEIQRCCAATTGHPVAVDHKEPPFNDDVLKMLGQQRHMFPMYRHPPVCHQPGFDQQHRSA